MEIPSALVTAEVECQAAAGARSRSGASPRADRGAYWPPVACADAARASPYSSEAACGADRDGLPGVEEGDDGKDAPVGVGRGGDSELAEDVLYVFFDRSLGYPEGLGDPGV